MLAYIFCLVLHVAAGGSINDALAEARVAYAASGEETTILIEPGDFATGFTASRKSTPDPEAFKAYPTYAESLRSIEHDEQSGLKPEYLAEKVAVIVACKRPAYHYIISNLEQRLSVTLKALLPQPWFAAILADYYKLK